MSTKKDDADVTVEVGSLEFSNSAGDQVLRFCQKTEKQIVKKGKLSIKRKEK